MKYFKLFSSKDWYQFRKHQQRVINFERTTSILQKDVKNVLKMLMLPKKSLQKKAQSSTYFTFIRLVKMVQKDPKFSQRYLLNRYRKSVLCFEETRTNSSFMKCYKKGTKISNVSSKWLIVTSLFGRGLYLNSKKKVTVLPVV